LKAYLNVYLKIIYLIISIANELVFMLSNADKINTWGTFRFLNTDPSYYPFTEQINTTSIFIL